MVHWVLQVMHWMNGTVVPSKIISAEINVLVLNTLC